MKYIVLLSVFLFVSCEETKAKDTTEVKPTDKKNTLFVKVETIRKQTLQDTLEFHGKLQSVQEIDMISLVSGRLKSFKPNGTQVNKGDILLEIEPEFYRKHRELARASFDMASKNHEKLNGNIKTYREMLESQAISKDELDSYEIQYLNAKRQLAEASVALEQAKMNDENARYRAPFSGEIGNVDLVVGQTISSGQMLGKLANMKRFKVVLSLSSDEIERLHVGNAVRFQKHHSVINGVVVSKSTIPDSRTGKYLAELQFTTDQKIISGLYGNVQVFAKTYENVYAFSNELIKSHNNTFFVYSVKNNQLKKIPVQKVKSIGNYVIVTGEFSDSTRLVNASTSRLSEGSDVSVIN